MLKKIFTTLLFLTCFVPIMASANADDDVWIYVFRLEYRQAALGPEVGLDVPYDLIPTAFEEKVLASAGDYYGIILTAKGREDARFGFNKPTTQNVSLGKSLLAVRAPYFANADHVSFYSHDEKHLFDISVRGSSFCNDNNSCDTQTGENYLNCPNDCPPPTPITPTPSPAVPTENLGGENNITPSVSPTPTPEPSSETIVKTPGSLPSLTLSSVTIAVLVVSIIVLLILFVVWKVRKNMD